jgi:Lrp/AsnC family transcriptional regulator, leucine-responsive regulatory protein
MNLTLTEKKVLSLLEQDCRMPAKQIAKKTGLSTEGVIKILHRVEKQDVILKYNTKLNYSRLGYSLFPVHLKLRKLNKAVMQDINRILSKYKIYIWHTFCEGEYDLLLSFKIRSKSDWNNMTQLLHEISKYVLEKEFSHAFYSFEVQTDFTGKLKTRKIFETLEINSPVFDISDEEEKILGLLRKNSRMSVLDISRATGISARVVALRIRKLLQNKVISGFKTKLNMTRIGFQHCVAFVDFGDASEEEQKRFISYCKCTEGIYYLVRSIGKYDFELTIDAENTTNFYAIVADIREVFPGIKKITTLISREK